MGSDPFTDDSEVFRIAFEDANDAIFWADPETGLIINCNRSAEVMLEKKKQDIIGHHQTELHPPDKAEHYASVFKKHIEQKGAVDDEAEVITKSGKIKSVHITASISSTKGKPIIQGIFRDITERKHAEKLFNSLYRISEAAHSAQTLNELFRSIHDIVSGLMPAKNFYIALYDSLTRIINFPYFVDEYDEPPAPRLFGKGLTEYVIRTGKPLLASPEIFKKLAKSNEVSIIGTPDIDWLGVPLTIEDRIIGVLTVQTYSEGVRYSEKDLDILRFVSDQVAMVIDRKRAEETSRNSEERLSAFMDSAPDAFALLDEELNLIEVNKIGLKMFPPGTRKQDVVGKNVVDIYPSIKETGQYKKYLEVVRTGTPFIIDDLVTDKEFGEIHLSVRAFRVGTGLGLIVTDITKRKEAEERLKTMATTDALTNVVNRGFGLLLFSKQLQLSKRLRSKLSICYVDVDGLKEINDTYGHQEGDEVLKMVSAFIKETLREIDLICRLGGDEFLIVLPQCARVHARAVWERISDKLEMFNASEVKPYAIRLSRGFVEYDPSQDRTVDQLIAIADREMYKDKKRK